MKQSIYIKGQSPVPNVRNKREYNRLKKNKSKKKIRSEKAAVYILSIFYEYVLCISGYVRKLCKKFSFLLKQFFKVCCNRNISAYKYICLQPFSPSSSFQIKSELLAQLLHHCVSRCMYACVLQRSKHWNYIEMMMNTRDDLNMCGILLRTLSWM